jgi:hypothetical protein
MWHDIHTFPDEAVEAHIMVQGKKMMPGHWATFNLALHPWSEPIEQAVASAEAKGVSIITPIVGQRIESDGAYQQEWWKTVTSEQ